jgi:succinate dehydrogenase/fumarate reductase flavoprotein subunit
MQRYEVLVVGSGGAGPTAPMLLSKLGVDHPRA